MNKLSKVISSISLAITTFCVAGITLSTVLQVLYRKALNNPLAWTDEFSSFMLVWLALFGSVWALHEKKHIAVDAFLNRLKGSTKLITEIFIDLAILVFVLVLIWYGTPLVLNLAGTYAVSLPVPKPLIYSAIPISSIFSVIIIANNVKCKINTLFHGLEV